MKSIRQIIIKNLKRHDFKQGKVGNCGLIASLAQLSQRPEFLKEIAPKIIYDKNSTQLQFKMFSRGKPTKVTVDHKLPLDDNKSLVYARSVRNDKFPLASYFEKAFVKKMCFSSYKICKSTEPLYALMSFSDCMVNRATWESEESKQGVIEYIKSEIENKSSLVLTLDKCIYDPQMKAYSAHAYAVIDYNCQYKAVKLYDPWCRPYERMNISGEKLPRSLSVNANPAKGQFWVTIDELEKRWLGIASLHSKEMYKSTFKLNEQIHFSHLDRVKRKVVWKAVFEERSTFMINFFSYSHEVTELDLTVAIVGSEGHENVDLNYDLPHKRFISGTTGHVEKSSYFQKFELQPNSYEFSIVFETSEEDILDKIDDFFIKVGCTSECAFS